MEKYKMFKITNQNNMVYIFKHMGKISAMSTLDQDLVYFLIVWSNPK